MKELSQNKTGKEQIKVMGRISRISLAPVVPSELWVAWEERVMGSQLHLNFHQCIQRSQSRKTAGWTPVMLWKEFHHNSSNSCVNCE